MKAGQAVTDPLEKRWSLHTTFTLEKGLTLAEKASSVVLLGPSNSQSTRLSLRPQVGLSHFPQNKSSLDMEQRMLMRSVAAMQQQNLEHTEAR